jgi:superfamily I DNA/RNA helicase
MKLMRGEVLFTAFNRDIRDELLARVPASENISVKTLNGAGYGIVIRNSFHKVTLDKEKRFKIVKAVFPVFKERREFGTMASRILGLLRADLCALIPAEVQDVADKHGIQIPPDRLEWLTDRIKKIAEINDELFEEEGIVDFDDQVFQAAKGIMSGEWGFPTYDWVLLDEAQDANKLNRVIIKALAGRRGRIVAIGDHHQGIYAFRGADCYSMQHLIQELEATVLPLSICYRCPTSVIDLAKKYVPQIESPEGKEEGRVTKTSIHAVLDLVEPGDLVLSRFNAPNVSLYFSLISQGTRAVIRGRDIGKSLIALVDRMIEKEGASPRNLDEFLRVLDEWKKREVERLVEAEKESAADLLMDRCKCIEVVGMYSKNPEEIRTRLTNLFQDKTNGGRVILSSIHKAKGLEADRVIILEHQKLPLRPRNPTDENVQQEINCYYVALTRAKKELFLA